MFRKIVGCLCVLSMGGVGVGLPAQVTTATAQQQARARVVVNVTDARGRAMSMAALPREEQARISSLTSSLQSSGGQQSRVTINCSWPPLRCTITMSWS